MSDHPLNYGDWRIGQAVADEQAHQQETLCLVASRAITGQAAARAASSAIANVTTEGYPGRRCHSGSRNADIIEQAARENACRLFGAEHANVQAHSASMAAGRRLAGEHRPAVIICDSSSYPRAIDFAGFRDIADKTGSILIADISHTAGLAATAEFRAVMVRVLDLAAILARMLSDSIDLVSGGTDSHIVLADLRERGLTSAMAESVLEAGGILANRNLVPGDKAPPHIAGGIRFGTNIAGYRGMHDDAFSECCALLVEMLDEASRGDGRSVPTATADRVRARIAEIMAAYPITGGWPAERGGA